MASAPQTIGRYEVLKEIGHGGMGVVYQARDPALQRTVALKTIALAGRTAPEERARFEKRFLQEARAAAALSHPCIVVVYDVGSDAATGLLYIALEYLRGKTMEGILAQGQRLDWREALRASSRLADALHHAHSHGIVHRDIKPANIMVLASGEPKIMDFGVAKVESSVLTTGAKVLGSPSYMSPEQAEGEPIDHRSDVFSLGSVLYELLTGGRAFAGRDLATILMRLATHEPDPPTRLVPELPSDIDAVLARALAKSPAARYPSARAFAEDLEDLLDGRPPRHAAPPSAGPSTGVTRGATGPSTSPRTTPAPRPPDLPPGEATVVSRAGRGALGLPAGKRLSVAFVSGERQGEVILLERPSAVIGRAGGGARAEVEVPDQEVSRTHAALECYGSRIVLRDLGSRNGTFVGERRVGEQELEDRAEFRVGRTTLMVIVAERD